MQRSICIKFKRAERATVTNCLAMPPWTYRQKKLVVAGIFWFQRLINRNRAIAILLIPQAMHQQRGHDEWLGGENFINGLIFPERVIARMGQQLAPESDLLQTALATKLTSRARAHVHIIIIEIATEPFRVVFTSGNLLQNVVHVLLTECAIVKPVVTHPAIDHGIHGHRYFQCRMRVHQRHQRQKPIIGNTENADLTIGFRDILYQPVDGVIGIGGMIYRRRVLRPAQGTIHHIIALGFILATNVLHHAYVATLNNGVRRIIVTLQDRPQMRAVAVVGQFICVVRCTRQKDRRTFGTAC